MWAQYKLILKMINKLKNSNISNNNNLPEKKEKKIIKKKSNNLIDPWFLIS